MTHAAVTTITTRLEAAANIVDFEDSGLTHARWAMDAWEAMLAG